MKVMKYIVTFYKFDIAQKKKRNYELQLHMGL